MGLVEPIRDIKIIEQLRQSFSHPIFVLIWDIGSKIGLRISDILALSIDIVGKDEITIREIKTGKLKKFPICSELKTEIENFYKTYRSKQKPFYNDETALFLGKQGKRLNRKNVFREFKRVAAILNIDNIGTHTMRKTFGYYHYKQYHDIVLLQTIFNHSSARITKRYIGITQDEITKSYKNFNLNSNNFKIKKFENNSLNEIVENKIYENNKILIETLEYMEKQINKKLDRIIKELCY